MLVSCNVYSIGFDFAAKDCFSGRKERSSKSNPKSTSTKDFSNVSKTFHQQIGKEKTFSFFFSGRIKGIWCCSLWEGDGKSWSFVCVGIVRRFCHSWVFSSCVNLVQDSHHDFHTAMLINKSQPNRKSQFQNPSHDVTHTPSLSIKPAYERNISGDRRGGNFFDFELFRLCTYEWGIRNEHH